MNDEYQYRSVLPKHKMTKLKNRIKIYDGILFTIRNRCDAIFSACTILLFLSILMVSCNQNPTEQQEIPTSNLKPYLDQTPPGNTPELFAPGIISTDRREGSLVVHPDGNEIYFWVYFHSKQITEIYVSTFADQLWSTPQILPFSGQHIEGYLAMHPTESRLYFQSNRPIDRSISRHEWNIWYADKTNGTWGKPQPMEPPINGRNDVSGPSLTLDGTMYFTVMKADRNDLYRSAYINGEYQEPEKLPDNVNSVKQQFDSYIAPDESYLLFGAYQRSDSYGGTDLYVSFRDQAGNWGDPINLGPTVNTSGDEGLATISPDGKYIFFTRLNGDNDLDVFWVSSQFLDGLR